MLVIISNINTKITKYWFQINLWLLLGALAMWYMKVLRKAVSGKIFKMPFKPMWEICRSSFHAFSTFLVGGGRGKKILWYKRFEFIQQVELVTFSVVEQQDKLNNSAIRESLSCTALSQPFYHVPQSRAGIGNLTRVYWYYKLLICCFGLV